MSEAAVPLPVPGEPSGPPTAPWRADLALVVAAFFFGTTLRVAFAAHIVILGETAGRHDAIRLTCVQVTAVGVACLAASVVTGGLAMGTDAYLAAAFTGVFATALAFFAMVWAQRIVSPSRAALILLLEPVFAALLARLTGDPLTAAALAGGVLILAAVVVAEVLPPWLAARGGRAPEAGTY